MIYNKFACFVTFAAVILLNCPLNGASPTEITVVATGVGETPEQAKKELILDGLRKASSTYVMSKEVVNNEDISSKLATFSEGIVKTTEITSQPQKDSQGIFKTTGKVTVVRKNLIDALRESKVTLNGAVRSDELLARAVSLKNLQTESNNIIEMILDDDPRRYDARLAGSLSLVPVQSLSEAEARESMSWVTASVVVTPNLRLYREEVLPKLITVLEAITEKAARHSVKFDSPHLIDGYVWPKLADKAGLDKAIEQHFAGVTFAGLIQNWAPAKDRAHISKELFLGADMMFGAKANALPVFTSMAKWYMSSCSRPFAAYNVSLVVPDINNNLELRSFSVAPAFFLPFSDLLKSRKSATPSNRTQGGSGSVKAPSGQASLEDNQPLVVTLSLTDSKGSIISKLQVPLPRGQWASPYIYAGAAAAKSDPNGVFIMPVSLVPRVCGAVGVSNSRVGNYVTQQKTVVTSLSAVSQATVTFRLPMSPERLANVSRMNVTAE